MKKLFSLLMLAMLTMSAMAGTVTFDLTAQGYQNGDEVTTLTADGVTLTFDKGSNNNAPKWFDNGSSVRMYGGNTLNVASTGDNITKVEFTFTGTGNTMNSTATASVDAGTYTENGTTGTWTGDVASFTITRGGTSGHARLTAISVTTGGEVVTTVADPVFTPEDGATFTESQEISLACATGGATISYSTDGLTWNEYTEPFTITETTTVYAKAALNGVESNVVSATYTKVEVSNDYIAFNCATELGNGSTERGEWTIEKDGVTIVCSDGTVYEGQNYRIYQNATLTFTSTVGAITMIEFDGVNNYPISRLSTETGTLSNNGNNGIWQGSASTVVFTASAQARATEFRVYVNGELATVTAPVFEPTSCVFTGSQVVALSCETEGAAIYYSINDGEYQLYSAPFTLTETATVKAYAELNGTQSTTNSATYTKRVEVTNVADANALDNKVDFIYYGDAAVTYQWLNPKNQYYSTWIVDANGNAGLIYGKQVPALNQGDVLDEEWEAQKTTYNGIPEFQYPNNVTASGNTWEINPVELATVTTADVNKYIIMKGQTITADATDTTGLRFINADSLVIYNQFGVELPAFEADKTYDVVAIATIYHNAPELYIISATEVQGTNVMRGDVNQDQTVNISDVTSLIDLLLGGGQAPAEADCNLDQAVNISDVTALIDYLLSGVWPVAE